MRQNRLKEKAAGKVYEGAEAGEDVILCPDDDEDRNGFGDDDDDGEPDEVRLFIQLGGRQFKPSTLAGRFRWITMRYIAESPHRGRGLCGLRAHGPHSIRHIGATDALKTTGSWEKAAQVIHDSVPVVRKIYVRWTPEDQGERAAKTAEQGRALPPAFAPGAGLVGRLNRDLSTGFLQRATPSRAFSLAA